MTGLSDKWSVYFVTLIFLGPWAFFAHAGNLNFAAHGGQDVPISSTDPGQESGSGIAQGVLGRVMGTNDRPVEGAFIQPRSLDDPSPPIPEIAILSDKNGRYSWPLFPGNYEITVSAEGYRRTSKNTTVKAGQVTTLDFELEREP